MVYFSRKEYTDTQEDVIPATGHTYEYTDNGDGTHTKVCTAGDDTATEPHTYQDGTCTYCGAEEPKEHVHEYGTPEFVTLGRPWQTEIYTETARDEEGNSYLTSYDKNRKSPTYENTSSAVTFIECTMDPAIQDSRWSVWTRKDEEGNTVDVTYHDDVRFAEINSKDTSGAYLNPDDYKNIVLGTMTLTDNAQETVDQLLGQMGFGAGVGNWNPTFTDYSGTKPQDIPGTGDGTGEGAGTVGNGNGNGASNGAGGNTAAENSAVRTGDTSNILPWIAVLLVSAAGVVFALRRKIAGKH